MAHERKRVVGHRPRWRNVSCFVNRLVQDRAVEPYDVLDVVVLDLSRIVFVPLVVMRRKMTVCDRVMVAGVGFVDVLRRER